MFIVEDIDLCDLYHGDWELSSDIFVDHCFYALM